MKYHILACSVALSLLTTGCSTLPTYSTPRTSLIPQSTNIPTQKKYINSKYQYSIEYPSYLIVLAEPGQQLENSQTVNFRNETDITPAQSGFAISIIENPKKQTFVTWIYNNQISSNFILVDSGVKSSNKKIGSYTWEKIENESVAVAPSGEVKYGLSYKDKILYIIDYQNNNEIIDKIISTIQWTY